VAMESPRNYWIEYDASYEDRNVVGNDNLVIPREEAFAPLFTRVSALMTT